MLLVTHKNIFQIHAKPQKNNEPNSSLQKLKRINRIKSKLP